MYCRAWLFLNVWTLIYHHHHHHLFQFICFMGSVDKAWHSLIWKRCIIRSANYKSTTQHGRIGGWSDFMIWSWSGLLITEESKPFTFRQTTEAGLMGSVFGLGLWELVCSQLLFARVFKSLCSEFKPDDLRFPIMPSRGVCSISFNYIWFLSAWACLTPSLRFLMA